MEKLLTCEQIAERYSVKTYTVWEWIRKKKLTAIKLNGSIYRIRAVDLEAFEKRHETMAKVTAYRKGVSK
jgi:excisionase family DNA binding protein